MINKLFNRLMTAAGLVMRPEAMMGRKLSTHYKVECVRDGKVVWVEEFDNLVVNAGLDDSLDKHLKGSSYTAAWYVGITTATPTFAAADTMASHAGWTESTVYSDSARRTLTLGTVSGQSVNNSASKAVFNINAGGTVGGAFVVTDSTKGGSTGTLYGGGAFTGGNRTVISGDTLNVTVTCTAAAS
jgi:hypothetical protein